MDKVKIEIARLVSCRVRRLKEALMETRELRYVKLYGSERYEFNLRELQEKLEFDILTYQTRIKKSLCSLTGYSSKTDLEIEYLSKEDLKSETLDISKLQDGSRLLNLKTGEISTQRARNLSNPN
jgi:hypothetical protein